MADFRSHGSLTSAFVRAHPVLRGGRGCLIGPSDVLSGLCLLACRGGDHATKHGHLALLGALSYLAPLLSTAPLVAIGNAPATIRLAAPPLLIIGGAVLATGLGRKTPTHKVGPPKKR